ncbi:MAG TPA: beta-ketoacyl-ACP synthase II [Candidatus Limnocylindrales bacterium]|jgi:3-oxoacyl-[acyl-carrier-protein] synthase II|nr:beta-ketoacyl-ACP synthase II [Candidatus Limnocylindrales bacterium]
MHRPDPNRRVAVTGLGVISPIGQAVETAWQSLVEGRTGLHRITRWDPEPYENQIAGEVNDFDATAWMDFKAVRRTDKNVVMGVAAAKQALADSGLEVTIDNRDDMGVIFGSGAGGPRLMMAGKDAWEQKGPRSVSPFFIANMLPDTASGQIAIETGIRGHNMCVVTACSTGTHNIGEAAEGIRRGDFVAAISGATENPLHEIVYIGFGNMRGMGTPREGEPLETVSRPFDLTRNGFVLGEGAGALMLEDLDHARARGARIYAEVVGYGSAADAWDLIQPVEKGDGVRRAMQMALDRHGVPADEVDLINPHGTSTPLGDLREAEGIWAVFGEHTPKVAISATKSLTGHLMGAAGAVEAVFTVLSVYHQCVPATANYRDPDPEIELDIVQGGPRPMEVRYALSDNIGLGGHNGAVVFKRYDGD